MIDSEKYIDERFGRTNPFRVPDGYFDDFARRLMERLPDTERKAKVVTMHSRRWMNTAIGVAAAVCIAIFGAAVYFPYANGTASTQQQLATASTTAQETIATNDSYVDEVVDYAMMDNSDIYAYLASE